jgi:hemerythrin-like domain-containing protein
MRQLNAGPAPSFEQPFEMLQACHERIHRMLALLDRLQAHLGVHGADEQARQAASDVMRYFDQAAPQHHLDEERHVFPPLLAQGDAALAALVQRLQDDHRRMEQAWSLARAQLELVAQGRLPTACEALATFAALYDEHIVAEEDIAYPAARARLDDAAVRRMAQDMMARRGA